MKISCALSLLCLKLCKFSHSILNKLLSFLQLYFEQETQRDANRFLLLSGKTGKSLGDYLETPDHKETYSPVTVYEKEDGAIYLFFGTGGETVKGRYFFFFFQAVFLDIAQGS